MILCFKCGIPIEPKLLNMCDRCVSMDLSIVSKIRKSVSIEHCRSCERYFTPPKNWTLYEWGSRELLIHLVKRNTSLDKLNIIDSNFIYTEEHSKRMKINITIEENGIRQDVQIGYVIRNKQCSDCEKVEAKQSWRAIVQVRHRNEHKRMFILLEQLIIKNKAYNDTTNIKMRKAGIDFYFFDRTKAVKLVNFIESVLPVKVISSERLISKDIQNAKSNYKFSFSVEIVPLCVDDLVILDKAFSNNLGIGNIVLVKKVANTITLLDPYLCKTIKISGSTYWNNKDKFYVLSSSKNFCKFSIVEIDKALLKNEGYKLVPISVTRNDIDILETKTHLGSTIKENDILLGYDLSNLNNNYKTNDVSDVIIVRKEANRDVIWKGVNNKDLSDEYFYFIEDIKNDKEILQNLCEPLVENQNIIREIDALLQ